ncbi:3-isopropylmalate dehydrogenase [hydrothermal vent metagenome]|uniref:3-isopropylmalate dehydrogenase n=1 Tax=hydrothermal vent metagenome TaxID=652676 RepID=A0A3B1E6Y1_9ZZZZ
MNKAYNIAVIKGDGIGPEIINEAKKVLDAVCAEDNFELIYTDYLMGGVAIDLEGEPLPNDTVQGSLSSDAVLFGAIGGEKWDDLPRDKRPETGLLKLRKALNVYANIRPVSIYEQLLNESVIKPDVLRGADFVIVRELVSGVYFGEPRGASEDKAFNTMCYTREEVTRVVTKAFDLAKNRSQKLCSVDKANVLEVSQFWRDIVDEISADYPEVTVEHMYVDNAAMQLIKNPKQFDVIVTSNLFGDILSDEASMISGSIGLLPSASLGNKTAIYEPIHGSAPDIAQQGIANPISTIASAALMLEYSLNKPESAKKIRQAISKALEDGYRTKDLLSNPDGEIVSTSEMGDIIANNITRH